MKLHTKYVGKSYRCRRCERQATERWWWARVWERIDQIREVRVAYFCGEKCADSYLNHRRNVVADTKQNLLNEILTLTLTGELSCGN